MTDANGSIRLLADGLFTKIRRGVSYWLTTDVGLFFSYLVFCCPLVSIKLSTHV